MRCERTSTRRDVGPGESGIQACDVDILGKMMQKFASILLRTCTTQPESAKGALEVMTICQI